MWSEILTVVEKGVFREEAAARNIGEVPFGITVSQKYVFLYLRNSTIHAVRLLHQFYCLSHLATITSNLWQAVHNMRGRCGAWKETLNKQHTEQEAG